MALTDSVVSDLRREFPSLQQTVGGKPLIFMDGPGGTQVHGSVIVAMGHYLTEANSNFHGGFLFSRRTDETAAVGAWVYVDAVHYAPHGPIDVQALDCDFLVCSVYKFFGPHQGVLYGRYDVLDSLPAFKVRPAGDEPPAKFETGTQSFEAMAGTAAAVNYLASVGQRCGSEFEAARLDEANIFGWAGNFYALAVTERLGLEGKGGMLRIGLAHYTAAAEVDTLLNVLADMPR